MMRNNGMNKPGVHRIDKNIEISLAMIVLNDYDFLNRAIMTSKDYFDEIVIVDGGSYDGSIDIAKKYTDKVFIHKWDNDYAKQRNNAISHCTKPYIFMLDADEVIEQKLLDTMKDIIEANSTIDMFLIPRINTITDLNTRPDLIDKYGWHLNANGWINYPDVQSRLFRNDKSIRYMNRVHERLIGFKSYVYLQGYHLLHEKNWERQIKQNNHYSEMQ